MQGEAGSGVKVLPGAPLSGLDVTALSLARSLVLAISVYLSHTLKHGTDLRSVGRGFLFRTGVPRS